MIEDVEQETEKLEEEVRKARFRDKRQKWWLFILAMLLMVAVAVIGVLLVDAWNRADRSAGAAVAEQTEKKEIAKEAQKALCGTVDKEIYDRALCEKWAAAAQEPVTKPQDAPVVVGGPSQSDLVQAFRAYCADGNCKGKDGSPPTADDIAAAFVKFCSGGRCTGPSGKDAPPAKNGTNGANGKDAQALPPSKEMVLAAVTQYCAAGACIGPAGAKGADGSPGPGPTAEAVLAAVQQVCANNACQGPAGPAGPAGSDGATGPAPAQFTFTDRTGSTYTCTPDPPGSTTYTCASSNPIPGVGP